jgi:hypothetical protein
MLESQQEFPTTLPAPLVEETPLLYRKGKRRAMTGLEVAEEREREMPHGSGEGLNGMLLQEQ